MANVYDLPAEVLLHIFRFYLESENQERLLNCLARVCSYWKEVCKNGILWTKYDGSVSYRTMMRLCKEGILSNTKEFTISETELLTNDDAENLFSKATSVEVIIFSHVVKIESETLPIIASKCLKLREIQIEKLKVKLNYAILGPFFASRGPGLVAVKLYLCYVTNLQQIIRCMADCCPNLEELHLRDLDCSSGYFPNKYVQKRCPKLKILHLDHNISISNNRHPFGFPDLEVFTYINQKGFNITDRNFECIVFNSPNLKFLNLTNCEISCEVLCTIPACSVEYLYIARSKMLSSKSLSDVFKKWCHSLKQVDVSHSKNSVINRAVWTLVTMPTESCLEILNLNFTQVIASVVEKVIRACTQLQVLHLEGCRNLERGMKKVYIGKSELNVLHKKLQTFVAANPSVHDPIELQ